MKYYYLSQCDFEKCPCWQQLTGYAESIAPAFADIRFWKGRQVNPNTYSAEYDVMLKSGHSYHLEVSCTMNPGHSYSYRTLKKTDIE